MDFGNYRKLSETIGNYRKLLEKEMLRNLLNQRRQVVGVFPNAEIAGQSLDRLVFSGFPIAQLFLIGSDQPLNPVNPAPNLADSCSIALSDSSQGAITGSAIALKQGIVCGNLVGGTSGLLLGIGLLALPGVGQMVLTSAIAFTLVSSGIFTVAGGVIGGLIGLGLSAGQVQQYSQQIAEGHVLLVVQGTLKQIDRAEQLLKKAIV